MISIEAYRASNGRLYSKLRYFTNTQNVFSFHQKWECLHHFVILTFFIVVFANTKTCPFCIIHIGNSWCYLCKLGEIQAYWLSIHFLELKYKGHNLNFLKLKQLFIDGDTESNPGFTQNNCKSPVGTQRKLKCLKEQ